MNRRNQKHVKTPSIGGNLQNISPKTMAAVALMAVMAILWGRVLLKGSGGPASAKAAEMKIQADLAAAAAATTTQQAQPASIHIERVELPVLPGRNDGITHNPFGAESWKAFTFHRQPESEAIEEKPVEATENTEERRHRENMKRIAGRLNLEGVIRDVNDVPFQAFVDGKILSVGSVLTVQEGPEEYELVLKKIEEKEVLFMWNDLTVSLKLTGTVER